MRLAASAVSALSRDISGSSLGAPQRLRTSKQWATGNCPPRDRSGQHRPCRNDDEGEKDGGDRIAKGLRPRLQRRAYGASASGRGMENLAIPIMCPSPNFSARLFLVPSGHRCPCCVYRPPRCSSALTSVVMIRAPLAPNGAMAPPLTFVRSSTPSPILAQAGARCSGTRLIGRSLSA